jgi:hypothetical protein
MKKDNVKQMLPSCLATLGLFAFSAVFLLLYRFSQYSLFYLSGIFLLLLATVNLILIIFNRENGDGAEQTTASDTENNEEKKKITFKERIKGILKLCLNALGDFVENNAQLLASLLIFAILVTFAVWFGASAWAQYPAPTVEYWHLALVAILFVLTIIADNLCKHSSADTHRTAMLNRNACLFFKLTKILLVILAATLTLKLLNVYDICAYAIYPIAALFYYISVTAAFLFLTVRIFEKRRWG